MNYLQYLRIQRYLQQESLNSENFRDSFRDTHRVFEVDQPLLYNQESQNSEILSEILDTFRDSEVRFLSLFLCLRSEYRETMKAFAIRYILRLQSRVAFFRY